MSLSYQRCYFPLIYGLFPEWPSCPWIVGISPLLAWVCHLRSFPSCGHVPPQRFCYPSVGEHFTDLVLGFVPALLWGLRNSFYNYIIPSWLTLEVVIDKTDWNTILMSMRVSLHFSVNSLQVTFRYSTCFSENCKLIFRSWTSLSSILLLVETRRRFGWNPLSCFLAALATACRPFVVALKDLAPVID